MAIQCGHTPNNNPSFPQLYPAFWEKYWWRLDPERLNRTKNKERKHHNYINFYRLMVHNIAILPPILSYQPSIFLVEMRKKMEGNKKNLNAITQNRLKSRLQRKWLVYKEKIYLLSYVKITLL